jgi:chemotaxis protein MotA
MEINVLFSTVLLVIIVFVGMPDLIKSPASYVHAPSLLIVLGGSFVALLMSSKFKNFKVFLKGIKFVYLPPKRMDASAAVEQLTELARTSKAGGKMSLISEVENIKDPFLKHGVQLVVDKLDNAFIRVTLYNDIEEMEKRHDVTIGMMKNMSQFTPIFGMIGTIVGLIQVLKNLQDPTKIGPAMAIALITTLYGGLFSGLVFVPFGQKLSLMSTEEAILKRLIAEGILLLEQEEIPLKVEKYLMSFLEQSKKEKKKK